MRVAAQIEFDSDFTDLSDLFWIISTINEYFNVAWIR